MHYKDGREARVGDVVKGVGYNVRGNDGLLKEIVATVVGITPGASSCNCQLAYICVTELPVSFVPPPYELYLEKGRMVCDPSLRGASGGANRSVTLGIEYGQLDSFELLWRP